MTKHLVLAGRSRRLLRILLACGVLWCAVPEVAFPATWQWSRMSGRERVLIALDNASQRTDTRRTARQNLGVLVTPPPQTLKRQGNAPDAQSLILGVTLADGVVNVSTNTPAFGFIATRPADNRVVLDIFSDPLGARWQSSGGLAPTPLPPAAAAAPPPGEPAPAPPERTTPFPSSPVTRTVVSTAAAPSGRGPSSAAQQSERTTVPAPVSTPSAPAGQTPAAVVPPAEQNNVSAPELTGSSSLQTEAAVPAGAASPQATDPTASGRPAEVSTLAVPPSAQVNTGGIEPDNAPVLVASRQTSQAVVPSAQAPGQPLTHAGSEAPHTDTNPENAAAASSVPSPPPPPAAPPVAAPSSSVVPAAPARLPMVRARLNKQGPEAWPEDKTLSSSSAPEMPQTGASPSDGGMSGTGPLSASPSTSAPGQLQAMPSSDTGPVEGTTVPTSPAASSPATPPVEVSAPQIPTQTGKLATQPDERLQQTDAGTPKKGTSPDDNQEEALPPRYVDEEGNPVPPPPDVPALLNQMRNSIKAGRYAEAMPPMRTLRTATLPTDEREELLYNLMTAMFETNRANLAAHGEELVDAANEAMNFNPESHRVPDALAVLIAVNLAQGNVADAHGYAQLMRRKFPGNTNVPAVFLDLGQKQMERQEYAEAALSFQTILQEYPESKMAKDAARLETYALYRQGHMDRALTLIDFVDRRWPRIYLEDPEYLRVSADIRFRQGRLENALQTYWTQYNLEPAKPEAAAVLQRIAEIYFRLKDPTAATKVLDELVRVFPLSAEAPKALMRLGENGVHDGNLTVDQLFALFDQPNPRLPSLYYQRILKDYPKSPEAMPAQLHTIAWQLWNKDYLPAMTAARAFMIDYEDKPESLRAKDILLRGFARELGNSLEEENYDRVLKLWDDFPQVHDYYQPLEPDLRMALARAHLNRGEETLGLDLLEPFLVGPGDTAYALYTYNMFLATYLREQKWDAILSLGEKVAGWKLPVEARNQLDYAMALSAENLGLQGRALPLWQKLAPMQNIPLYQRAYASYFLARDAERRQDLRDAYQYNLDTLGMFTQLQDEQSPYADAERVRESIAALMDVTEIAGRYAESLEWASKYAAFVPETSPDYAGLRFREARLHRKMGDTARWRAILQGIVDKEPDSVFGKMAASELHTQDVARDLTRFTGN